MGTKLERLRAELERARHRSEDYKAKVKELEQKVKDEEDSEVHELIMAANLTPEQLAVLLRRVSNTLPSPDQIPGGGENYVE